MHRNQTRRGFLRFFAAGAAALGVGACSRDGRAPGETSPGEAAPSAPAEADVLHRALILPHGSDDVRIAAPLRRRPVAYVSMATRQAFIDRSHRDRASWLLDAHISVSTGLWRIPLPGDSRRIPISPGDERREFEEMDMGAWDPATVPEEGDIRIVLGKAGPAVVRPACLPVQGTEEWVATGTMSFSRCEPGPGQPVREDFRRVAPARRHVDRGCSDGGVPVSVYGWVCREE